MLGEVDTTLLNSEVANLQEKIASAYTLHAQYACRFWDSHLKNVVAIDHVRAVASTLDRFAETCLLPWLEAMSWFGQTRQAIHCLEVAKTWVVCSSIQFMNFM